ncbi:MAG: MarR family transcriptional regulator [Oscillospiraceae bacterium]|nr:MarR family transcriptional regulator [Oscillospiraceae bacterium]
MSNEEQTRVQGIIKRLWRIDRSHKAIIDAQVHRLGIHRSQHNVLMYLHFCKEAPTQEDIANIFEISPAAVAVTLKKLEGAGLIERVTRKGNGRAKEVRLTEEGEEIVRVSREMIDRADEALTAGFSDGDLTRLEDFLDRMAENMKSVQENGDAEISAKQKTEQERLESL